MRPNTTAGAWLGGACGRHEVISKASAHAHHSSTLVLVLAVFGASLVEMVEALTLVVAAG